MQDTQQLQSAISTFPLPLAQALRRAVNAKSPQEQHNGAYYFFESALKLSASAQLGVYCSLGCAHGPLNQLIENLTRPSVGHWLALLRETAAFLASRQDSALLPLQGVHDRLTRKQALPAVKAFLEFAARASDKQEGRQVLRVLDFFDAVVSYRNQELGHGAMRERGFYAEAAPLLLEAALEAMNFLRPVGDLQFVVARDLVDPRTQKALRRFDVLRGDGLHLPLETNQQRDAEIPVGQLLLAAGTTRVPLHPLLVYEIDKLDRDRVGFLNQVASQGRGDTQRLKRVEYLDYDSGDRLESHDALNELAALLTKVRGQVVSVEAVAALSQGGTEINVGAAPNDKGQFIADFELLEELGRGGMGIVYKARQNSLRRVVALKVLPPGLAGDPVSVARFKREIAALGRCDHPNVVKVLTAGQDGERHFYAMEYVEGSDLAQVCGVLSKWKTGSLKEGHILKAITDSRAHRAPGAKTGQAPLPEVPKAAEIVPEISEGRDYFSRLAEILGDAASGVQHLHEHGIIHRDLKPANVMLTGDGKRAVIMDLGLAQLQDRSLSLTASSVKILGTLRYMPPEQLQHQMLEVTPKADIYSLGATLYELVALAPMFDGDTEARLMQQVLQEDPRPARSHNAAIPRDLETIITVATAKSPADRYASAGVLAQDLRAFSRGEPISARAPTTFHYLKLFYRKNTRLVQGMAAALVALLALTAWFIVRLDESRDDAERSAEVAREKEAQAKREAERANKAELDAKEKAAAAQKARDEANVQKGVAEAKTKEVEAALKEAARNLQQIHMERGKAAAERGEPGVALNHFAQVARMAEELGDAARLKQAWDSFCLVEPRVPLELWRTDQSGFSKVQGDLALSRDGAVMAGTCDQNVVCVETATGRTLFSVNVQRVESFLELSGDGKRLLIARYGYAQLWDVSAAAKIADLNLTDVDVKAARFSADDKCLCILDGSGKLHEFDSATGTELSMRVLAKQVYNASFSPDASHLLLYGQDDYFDLFETANWNSLVQAKLGINYVRCMALSPGGKVALICTDKGKIEAWDVLAQSKLTVLDAQCSYGRSIAFSLDGRAAVVSAVGEVALFNGNWDQPRKLKTVAKRACSVRFMPDGNTLVLGQSQAAPVFLDSRDGKNMMQASGIGSTPVSVALSPDKSQVAVGTFDNRIVLLDSATGRQIRVLDKIPVLPFQVLFLPDARRIATFTLKARGACILDIETGEAVRSFDVNGADEAVTCLACSPDGRFLYVATNVGRVMRCSVDNAEKPRVFAANRGELSGRSIAFMRVSANGNILTVADLMGGVCRLAADDGSLLRVFDARAERGELLSLNKEGTRALFGVKPDRLFVRELESGKISPIEYDSTKRLERAEFAENGDLLTVDMDFCIRAYSAETGSSRIVLHRPAEKPLQFILDESGRSIVVASEGGVARYALERARHLALPSIGQGDVFDLLWLPGTSLLAVGGLGEPVSVIDVNASRVVERFGGRAVARVGLSVSPDGNTLLCGGMASHVVALDLTLHKERDWYKIPAGKIVFSTDFSSDGSLVALAQATEGDEENGSLVVLLKAESGALVREIKTGKGLCVSARFIANGKQLLVGCINAKPAIFDVASGERVQEFGDVCEQSLAYSINASQTVGVFPGKDYLLKLYELTTGKDLGTLDGHTSRVTRAAFSPDGSRIATIGGDNTVRLWDAATCKELAKSDCNHSTDITGLTFTPDGGALIFTDRASKLRLWDVDSSRTFSAAKNVKAADMLALARRLACLRLDGFEARSEPPPEVSVSWTTSDGKAPVAAMRSGESTAPDLIPPALQSWSLSLRQWLNDWLVMRPQMDWRHRYAGWRYTEFTDEKGNKREKGVPLSAPWTAEQRVAHASCWEREHHADSVTLYHMLWRAEEEGRWEDAVKASFDLNKQAQADDWLLYRRGRACLYAESWDMACDTFEDYLKKDPENLSAMAGWAVAMSHFDYGLSNREVLERLNKAITAGLRNAPVYVARARYRALEIRYDADVLADCASALELDASTTDAMVVMAGVLARQEKLADAETWYTKALALRQDLWKFWSYRAQLRAQRQNYAGAVEDYARSIELLAKMDLSERLGSLYRAYMGRAALYVELADSAKALADYSLAIEELPNDYDARLARGNIYLEKAQWLDAFTDFEVCLANSEDQGSTHLYGSGRAALELRDYSLASERLRGFINSAGNEPRLMASLYAARAQAMFADGVEKDNLEFPCRTEEQRTALKRQFTELTQAQRQRQANAEIDACFEYLNNLAKEKFKDAERLEKEPQLERARKDPRWADVIKAVEANNK